jgi:hypothetical protein
MYAGVPRHARRLAADPVRQPEIDHPEPAVVAEDDVARLQIEVRDAGGVRGVEGAREIASEAQGFTDGQALASEALV